MKNLGSFKEAEEVAKTVAIAVKTTGTIPEPLLKSLQKSLKRASPGVVQKFFNVLTQENPEALKFFTD